MQSHYLIFHSTLSTAIIIPKNNIVQSQFNIIVHILLLIKQHLPSKNFPRIVDPPQQEKSPSL